MQRRAFLYGSDWSAGSFSSSALDYSVAVSPYSHPALVAQRTVSSTLSETGAQAVGTTQPAGTGMPSITQSNAYGAGSAQWAVLGTGGALAVLGYTTQAGDQLTFTTASGTYQVTISLAGIITAGMGLGAGQGLDASSLRNGAKAAILVDGTVVQTLDCYGATPQLTLYLDGNAHTVIIQHTGGYNGAISPIGPVSATGAGTSVSSMLSVATIYRPTFVSATWRLAATATNQYSLYKTPQGGTEALVASGLATGTTYSGGGYVPGVTLLVNSTLALTIGDGATFTTDVVMLGVQSIAYGTGTGSGAATWTSPVLDWGDPGVQMVAAEMVQSTPLSSVTLKSGNTSAPDGTWTTVSARTGSATTSDGTEYGTAGLMAAPPGRYGQLVLHLAGVGTLSPWVRDLVLYAWNPATDPLAQRLQLHAKQVYGPSLAALLGALGTWYADVAAEKDRLRAAVSIGGATDEYLSGYMTDLGLGWVTGEPTEAARARARGVLSSAGGALSLVGIAQQVCLLVNGVSAPVTVSGSPGSLLAACGGVQVNQVAGIHWNYNVAIPAAPYNGLPGLAVGPSTTSGTANAIISSFVQQALRPVGSQVAAISFTTSS